MQGCIRDVSYCLGVFEGTGVAGCGVVGGAPGGGVVTGGVTCGIADEFVLTLPGADAGGVGVALIGLSTEFMFF